MYEEHNKSENKETPTRQHNRKLNYQKNCSTDMRMLMGHQINTFFVLMPQGCAIFLCGM